MKTSIHALTIAEHKDTGRLVVTCEKLPGFIAHGRDNEQLRERIPKVLRRYLERDGRVVESIELKPDAPETPSNIRIRSFDNLTAVAVYAEAA